MTTNGMSAGPQTSRLNMPFTGLSSFMRARVCENIDSLEDASFAILGVPTDEGSPYYPGSRMAPRSIREHSMRFGAGGRGYYDPQEGRYFLDEEMTGGRIVDVGDVDILPTNVEGTFANITDSVSSIVSRGAKPVIIGGDHAISFPVVRAFEDELHVIHFDAHLDYAPFVHGVQYSNSNAFRHIKKLSNVVSLTQVGIRSIRNTEQMMTDSLADGNSVVTMRGFRESRADSVLALIPAGSNVYVSIDIDVLDLALVPGCVSAEPDGMQYNELRDSLRALSAHANIIGFDLVEVNPLLDVGTGITSYLGAHTMIEFLGHMCK